MDWNNDGKKDLITGERNGTIRIYLNVNTDEDPQFNGFSYLKINGSNYDCGLNSHPFVVDWNNDGAFDLLVGDDSGKVHYLQNKGGLVPDFNAPVYLKNGTATLTTGNEASPAVADFNGDGNKDLVVGDYQGRILYFENKGDDEWPVFSGYQTLTAGGSTIDVQYYARIDVYDWNNDGVMDILSGNRNYNGTPTGGVWYFETMGPLSADTHAITESAGGTVKFTLNADATGGSRDYLVLASISGTQPGTPLPGGQVTLPLNWDLMTTSVVNLANTPIFDQFMGSLSILGQGSATFALPAGVPGTAGLTIHFAYALANPWDLVSNPVAIEVQP